MEDYMYIEVDEITSPGWNLQEYEAACKDATFYASVSANLDADATATTIEEKLLAKYFIAGSKARWMFSFNTEKATHDITRYFQKVNSVADGWVFQMDFLFHLQAARSRSTLTFTNSLEAWPAPIHYDFHKEDDLKTLGISKLIDNCWLIPTKINQGCYDVLQLLLSTSTLRVVQLTVASILSLKLCYVISILQVLKQIAINIKALDIVFVLPPQTVPHFAVSKVESHKNSAITDLGWDVPNTRKLGFKRIGIMYDL